MSATRFVLTLWFSYLTLWSSVAMGECKDTVLHFQEDASGVNDVTRSMTTILFCQGDRLLLPDATLMHFMEARDGKICYRDMSCGHLRKWKGFISIQGTWFWYDDFNEFLGGDWTITNDAGSISSVADYAYRTDWDGGAFSLRLSVDWGQVKRHCSEPSPEICI